MHDRSDALLGEDALDQRAVVDATLIERDILGNDVAVAGREIVDDGDAPARIAQGEDGVAADIAGTAGNKHGDFGHRQGR